MLKLICGVSGSGKTTMVLDEIKERAKQGKKSLLIVPEQFSSSAETGTYAVLGDNLSQYAAVYSFTSYAEYVLKTYGGIAVPIISDAGRVVLVRRAVESLGDTIETYRRNKNNTGFCMMCAEAITELKSAGVQSEKLLEITKPLGDDGKKLYELGLIFAAYEAFLKDTAADPSDRITMAANKLSDDALTETAVYIDNFDGFIAPQYLMIRKLLHAENCTVTLCCDDTLNGAEYDLFSSVRKTAQRLKNIAKKEGVSIAPEIPLEKNFRAENVPSLIAINEIEAFDTTDITDNSAVLLTQAENVYDEANVVACQIARLARAGVRYSDIAVICRSDNKYEAAIKYEFGLYNIPFFLDRADTLEHTAPASFFRAALALAAHGLSTEGVLRLLKTDLCNIVPEELSCLENYAYTWQPKAEDWRNVFDKNPSGFGNSMSFDDKKTLEQAEKLRARVIPLINNFISAVKDKTADVISKQLYLLLVNLGGEKSTENQAKQLDDAGEAERADALYDVWNKCAALLSQMPVLLNDSEISAAEYDDLLVILLRATEIGHVPQTQNAVVFATADRMRLNAPQYCFVLGANEGEFPLTPGSSGLLSHADRDLLVKNDIEMPGSFENRTLLEQMFFYRAITAPSKALYVSCGKDTLTGAFSVIESKLALQPLSFTFEEKATSTAAALELLGKNYRVDTTEIASLENALESKKESAEVVDIMKSSAQKRQFENLNTEIMAKLLGDSMKISPTRVEQYYRCKFSYFMQYVLRVRPLKRAELSPLETGTLMHYILENVIKDTDDKFTTLTEAELRTLVAECTEKYVTENMPDKSEFFKYAINRIKESALAFLKFIQQEQEQSSFHPVAFEQRIDENGIIKPLEFTTNDGNSIKIIGTIDRVDTMKQGDETYIRVVDYKSSNKNFSLTDVYCGLDTQMLFYLFTLTENAGKIYPNPIAAGVLYMGGDPAPSEKSRKEAQTPLTHSINGIILDDEAVIDGMDKNRTGEFSPVKFNKPKDNGKAPVKAGQKTAGDYKFKNIEDYLGKIVIEMADGLYSGEVDAVSMASNGVNPCDRCDYRVVCGHESGINELKAEADSNVFENPEV